MSVTLGKAIITPHLNGKNELKSSPSDAPSGTSQSVVLRVGPGHGLLRLRWLRCSGTPMIAVLPSNFEKINGLLEKWLPQSLRERCLALALKHPLGRHH